MKACRLGTITACAVMLSLAAPTPAAEIWPGDHWPTAKPSEVGMDKSRLEQARKYALSGGGSGYVIRHGKLVMSWGDPRRRYDLKSTTKSIGVSALGLAIADGKIALADKAIKHHPEFARRPKSNLRNDWIEAITIQHLATQTAGFEKPGGYGKLLFAPGTKWSYSDGGPNWLAECITLSYRRDLQELMFERLFAPIGISRRDLSWRENAYRPKKIDGIKNREFGSGIHANVDAMARIGYLYLREGRWQEKTLLPAKFIRTATGPIASIRGLPELDPKHFGNASDHYGLLWWNNGDGTLPHVPRDAYWSWGLYDSLIVVIPSLDLVITRAGRSWERQWSGHYKVLEPFFDPIVSSIKAPVPRRQSQVEDARPPRQSGQKTPYPRSQVITGIDWAPASSIVRRAHGSDNWPITWGSDDRLYTAYGDGRGFRPFVEKKLSLGLATVTGSPEDFVGTNLRSSSIEQTGNGKSGPKASGLLMVDDVLYMLVRNRGNSQLAWSKDRGHSWHWSPWRFETSFGYPTFLNFGKNYTGSRDRYVYIYSHDSPSAYQRADRMVLARVPRDRITDRQAYEFFTGLQEGHLQWSRDIAQRGAVFVNPGQCYRSSVSYHPVWKRYLWCQTGQGGDPRFQGGLAIYESPEPWGPWRTVYWTDAWDVGPGETCSLPTKWMSADGETVHLVFSGNDAFSVRRGRLRVGSP